MDEDGGVDSPDRYGGGGGGTIRLVCDSCGATEDYSPDDYSDDGFLSCSLCGARHRHTQATATEPDEISRIMTGPIYIIRPPTQTPKPRTPAPYPATQQPPAAPAFNEFDEPRDFVTGADEAWGQPDELGDRVRRRYVQGLQVILQRQLESLVERHRVGALVCGVAGTVWLRWVAASKVFDETWARKVLREDEAKRSATGGQQKPQEVKSEWASPKKDRRKAEFIFLRSLRMTLPLYSTLSVCFLACHIAREAVLPTNISRWAMEGKLPYMAAFTQVDKLLGSSVGQHCSLSARQLFRPVRVIGAWQLEAATGSIARRIGLRLPSVNFYAIAQRYLNELSLPVERILPCACRIYEWAMPAGLWLSSNPARVPTWVCVMAILIVALRIQYNINGHGIWEEISEAGKNTCLTDGGTSEEFGAKELLCALADTHDKIGVAHDYSKDLHSYLKYCKDVVFPGIACSDEEKHLIEIFQDMYRGEDEHLKAHMEDM